MDTENEKPAGNSEAVRKPAPDTHRGEARPVEFGGRRDGLEPTRYGDWEKDGRCIDF